MVFKLTCSSQYFQEGSGRSNSVERYWRSSNSAGSSYQDFLALVRCSLSFRLFGTGNFTNVGHWWSFMSASFNFILQFGQVLLQLGMWRPRCQLVLKFFEHLGHFVGFSSASFPKQYSFICLCRASFLEKGFLQATHWNDCAKSPWCDVLCLTKLDWWLNPLLQISQK